MKKKSAVLILVVAICAVFLLAACGNAPGSSALLGKWKEETTSLAAMEFKADGTLNVYFMEQPAVSWELHKTDGNNITMTVAGEEQKGTYKVEGKQADSGKLPGAGRGLRQRIARLGTKKRGLPRFFVSVWLSLPVRTRLSRQTVQLPRCYSCGKYHNYKEKGRRLFTHLFEEYRMVLKTEDYLDEKRSRFVSGFCALFLIVACASSTSIVGKRRSDVYSEAAWSSGDGTPVAYLNDQARSRGLTGPKATKPSSPRTAWNRRVRSRSKGTSSILSDSENQTDIFTRE